MRQLLWTLVFQFQLLTGSCYFFTFLDHISTEQPPPCFLFMKTRSDFLDWTWRPFWILKLRSNLLFLMSRIPSAYTIWFHIQNFQSMNISILFSRFYYNFAVIVYLCISFSFNPKTAGNQYTNGRRQSGTKEKIHF